MTTESSCAHSSAAGEASQVRGPSRYTGLAMGPGEVPTFKHREGGEGLPRILAGCAARQKGVMRRLESCAEGLLCPRTIAAGWGCPFSHKRAVCPVRFSSPAPRTPRSASPFPGAGPSLLPQLPALPRRPAHPQPLMCLARSCHTGPWLLLLVLPLPSFCGHTTPMVPDLCGPLVERPRGVLGPQAFDPH